MTRTEEGLLHWRDWLADNCPDDVLSPQAKDALRELPRECVSAYLRSPVGHKHVSDQFDSCGPLVFFSWSTTRLPSAPKDEWKRHKFWCKANDKVKDYLRTWYGDEYAVMQLIMQQHQ